MKISNGVKRIAFFSFFLLLFWFLPKESEAADLSEKSINGLPDGEYVFRVADFEDKLSGKDLAGWFAASSSLRVDRSYWSEIETPYLPKKIDSITNLLTLPVTERYRLKKTTSFSIDVNKISLYLEDLARNSKKESQNAQLEFEENKVSLFASSKRGIELDLEKSREKILEFLTSSDFGEKTIILPYRETDPEISEASINNLGINELVGEGTSNFAGSPKSRIHNINVSVSRFTGVLIKPGEEFSFVKNLGEVDGEHGYLPELVIKKDKTEPEFGGGICQVSTTMFRAAINTGLKITARRNHAYPVSYYNPQGMDATVYIPSPDLRFINNTPAHILIQSKIEGTKLTFQFYGTSDGRKIEIKGPTVTERKPDGGMKTIFYQKVIDSQGNAMFEDSFKSNYDSPDKYPHPGEVFSTRPDGWSKKQWEDYKKAHGL